MSAEDDAFSIHNRDVDVNGQNASNSEKSSDFSVEIMELCSKTLLSSSDSELSPIKSSAPDLEEVKEFAINDGTSDKSNNIDRNFSSSPVLSTSDSSPVTDSRNCVQASLSLIAVPAKDTYELSSDCCKENAIISTNMYVENNFKLNSSLATSCMSLDEQNSNQNMMNNSLHTRSAENILSVEKSGSELTENNLDREKILSQFTNHKSKVSSVQQIPGDMSSICNKSEMKTSDNSVNIDGRYPRMSKEILSQDIGSIVKNVHGLFSSVSGSLKYAYNQRSVQKPVKYAQPVPSGKIMNDIFEGETNSKTLAINESETQKSVSDISANVKENVTFSLENYNNNQDELNQESDTKKDILKLQVETLERLLLEQRKENTSLKDRVKQQTDELYEKDQTFKELEVKLDLMCKRVEQAEREKDAAVMRYAGVECAAIEARRAAEQAAAGETSARAEVELLNNKLKGAHAEKHRIIQLYDDKCHELQNAEREMLKAREDVKKLEGRLKWTQSKLRMEMDAYKESSERAEKLSQRVAELEAARETALASVTDTHRAKLLEADLKECRAALILCRHEKEELERRLSSLSQQLDTCKKERDDACTALVEASMEVERLKINNLRLEEEAAELAALRAKAALADTLSGQLQRETERAAQAEEALSSARALAETCARREAAALEHAAKLTHQHVASRHGTQQYEAKAQALSADNASLRERVAALESECGELREALREETERRNKENRVLARKVAELTEEVAEANKKLEWEKGENGVLKKKHASAIKELNRELQRSLKRCEQLEAKLPPPDAPSTRTGSVTSLSSMESAATEDRLQNGHVDLPDIQVREPDRQALIERIVSLQRAAARRAERCEFLEEHSKQLTNELRSKSRLLRHMLTSMPAGAVVSEDRDINKKEIARLGGGAMAAVWGGDRGGMTLELSLEMNTRLQALLEDTLLKNITLKENMDTLGAEISRLKEKYPEAK